MAGDFTGTIIYARIIRDGAGVSDGVEIRVKVGDAIEHLWLSDEQAASVLVDCKVNVSLQQTGRDDGAKA